MTPSDKVRNFCLENYTIPARERGENTVSIRAGDVHKALNYIKRFPLVCASLGLNKFEEMANVERISIEVPTNGSNAVYVFIVKENI